MSTTEKPNALGNGTGAAGKDIRVRLLTEEELLRVQPELLEALFAGDIDPKRDSIVIAESGGKIVGAMALRLAVIVHDFAIPPCLVQGKIADALFAYASGYVRAAFQNPIEALFLVEPGNDRMQRWLAGRGAIEEKPSLSHVYTLEVR